MWAAPKGVSYEVAVTQFTLQTAVAFLELCRTGEMIRNVNNPFCVVFSFLCGRAAKDADSVFATTSIYFVIGKI